MTKEVPAFIQKTFNILQNEEYQNIIEWNEDGMGFRVKDVNQFSEIILPLYFKHSNYSSFIRQLNMYDFHKSSSADLFLHQYFQKNRKDLLSSIKRKFMVSQVEPSIDDSHKIDQMNCKYDQLSLICSQIMKQNHLVLKQNKTLLKHFEEKKKTKQLCLTYD